MTSHFLHEGDGVLCSLAISNVEKLGGGQCTSESLLLSHLADIIAMSVLFFLFMNCIILYSLLAWNISISPAQDGIT